ncbi:MAG: hypothetical protein HFF76_00485 [Oscillospiraceae bacterium]|jgi:hypothetical protein|nr:hypothetical protein [Oscillospiraceae bacterium]
MSKKLVDRLQNVALVVLTLSAVFLLLSFFHLRGGWTARFQTLLAVRPAAGGQEEASGVGELLAAPHIMVTSDSEYGRCGRLYTPAGDALLEQMLPLFGEALGSADQVGAAADQTLRAGLGRSSLYLDLTVELPLEVVAAWLGERTVFDRAVRAMALTTEGRDTAVLYLCGGEGEIFRYFTALPASAVEALTESVSPNGSLFAYETNYAPLAPYTVLVREAEGLPQVRSELPATYSSYRLLTALDFNAHTNSRYAEPGGTEVVMDGRRTLRIGPEGTVTYDSGEEDAGGRGGALEALRAAGRLAAALTGGVDASPLYLRRLEAREDGYLVGFQYQVEGVPVRFPDEADALTVLVRGAGIAEFTCRCRTYVPEEEASVLLPPIMAAAIASLYPEGELSLGYVDSGSGRLHADWLV